jgi:hypothetical protein
MRPLVMSVVVMCLIGPVPAAEPSRPLPFRVVFRHGQEPASVGDYESEVTVFERLVGGEKLLGKFTGSIFPDDLFKCGRIKDGKYDLYLGLHHRSKDGKALTPSPADLVVKSNGWLRPALIVNADGPVPVLSHNPKKKISRLIHVHNGYKTRRHSEGCLTLAPADWERFITIFLSRYHKLEDWHQHGRYIGRKVAVLEVVAR